MNPKDIMKRVYRQAINKRRPPTCSIFRVLNHGTILLAKIWIARLQNSYFRSSKFAFQTFQIRASDLQNSRFEASKFKLQVSKIPASSLKKVSLKMDRNSRLWAKILFEITNEQWIADKYSLDKTSASKYTQRGRGRLRPRPLCMSFAPEVLSKEYLSAIHYSFVISNSSSAHRLEFGSIFRFMFSLETRLLEPWSVNFEGLKRESRMS